MIVAHHRNKDKNLMRQENNKVGFKLFNNINENWSKLVEFGYKKRLYVNLALLFFVFLAGVLEICGKTVPAIIAISIAFFIELLILYLNYEADNAVEDQVDALYGINEKYSSRIKDLYLALEGSKRGRDNRNNLKNIQKDLLMLVTEGADIATDLKFKDNEFCSNLMIPVWNNDTIILRLVQYSDKGWREVSDLTIGECNTPFGATKAFIEKEIAYIDNTEDYDSYGRTFKDKNYKSVVSVPILISKRKPPIAIINIDTPHKFAFGEKMIDVKDKDLKLIKELEQIIKPWVYSISLTLPVYNQTLNGRNRRQ